MSMLSEAIWGECLIWRIPLIEDLIKPTLGLSANYGEAFALKNIVG